MVKLANLVRKSFSNNDISTIISPRTSIIWAQNIEIFDNTELAFKLTFFNKKEKILGEITFIVETQSDEPISTISSKDILNSKKDKLIYLVFLFLKNPLQKEVYNIISLFEIVLYY